MKTLAILSQKGGSSKTTLAVHLAVEIEKNGHPVALLDLDPQASAAGWADSRAADSPSVTPIPASRLPHALTVAREAGAGVVVVDTAPHSADAAIAAAEASDLILIPCRPGVLDLRAIATTARIARLAGRPAYAVLTQIPPNAPRLAEDAIEAIRTHGLDVCPIRVHQRAAYAHALVVGLTASEYEPSGKAASEIHQLYEWISNMLLLAK